MQHRDYFEKEVRTVLCVRDLERSRNFYQQTLELVPVWDGGMEGCRFAAAGGAVELRPVGADLPQGPTTIMLEADNVDDCYSRLARKPGLHVYEHIADRPYGIRLFQLLAAGTAGFHTGGPRYVHKHAAPVFLPAANSSHQHCPPPA